MKQFKAVEYPGEVFTVEKIESGVFQTVYPADLAEYGGLFMSASLAWHDLFEVAADENLILAEVSQ